MHGSQDNTWAVLKAKIAHYPPRIPIKEERVIRAQRQAHRDSLPSPEEDRDFLYEELIADWALADDYNLHWVYNYNLPSPILETSEHPYDSLFPAWEPHHLRDRGNYHYIPSYDLQEVFPDLDDPLSRLAYEIRALTAWILNGGRFIFAFIKF